jgi:hypothetical protein
MVLEAALASTPRSAPNICYKDLKIKMKIASQRDPRWAKIKLGTCTDTIGSHGCAITSVAALAGLTPPEVNKKAAYIKGCLLNWEKTAHLLGLEWSSERKKVLRYPCVAEVRLTPTLQHFIIVDGINQYDPWTGTIPKVPYKIISYRNITTKDIDMAVTSANANGILFALDKKLDHGADSGLLAEALNTGNQKAVNDIISRYTPKDPRIEQIKQLLS